MAQPAAKKAKTEEEEAVKTTEEVEEKAEEKTEEPKEPEPPVEHEQDAKPVKGPKITEPVAFHTSDTTMNVMQGLYGNILMPLTDGGLQYFVAAARGSTGLKSGRYAFEVKLIEIMNPADDPQARQRMPGPRHSLRVGFSTASSSLFVGETEDSMCFDMEGAFIHNKTKSTCSQKFGVDTVVAVVLNLDATSPNANTISLFSNGVRASQPQPLPDSLKGKTLFPTVAFKNVTVHYNFGPTMIVDLPFSCHTLGSALAKDAVVNPSPAKDAKHEVVFPVCLPDEGTFDWLDMFLEKNPGHTELSDRAILQWAAQSGIVKARGVKSSNDKPEFGFGVTALDNHSIKRVLQAIAPLQERDYIVMEVKSNIITDERKELVSKWASSGLKRRAQVMMGEPPAAFKKRSQELALKEKQEQSDLEFKVKLAETKKKKELEKKQKKLEKEKAKALKKQQKAQEAIKKKLEVEKKKKEAAAKGEEYVEEEEEKKEEEPEEEEPEEPEEEDEAMDEDPPTVQLTDEEKKQSFRQGTVPDLTPYSMNTSFIKFAIPEKDEGFDEVSFEWAKEPKCKEFLKQWIQDKKTTTRVEDLQPGDWFLAQWKDWQKILQSWHSKQNIYKAQVTKKAADKAAKQAKKAAAAAAKEHKAKAAVAKKVAAEKAKKEAAEKGEIVEAEEEKEDEPMEEPEEEEEEEQEDSKVDFDKLDVFGIEDILDVGGGEPLFSTFGFEDWTMMSLRFELHLLAHAFKRDVNDPDRMGIHLEHLSFYYQKYYKKSMNQKFYGVETMQELLDLLKDTVYVTKKTKVVEAQLPTEFESLGVFVMLTEEARRDRVRRVDLGDETARLKLQNPAMPQAGAQGSLLPRPAVVVSGIRPAAAPVPGAVRPAGAWQQPAFRPPAGAWQQPGSFRPPMAGQVRPFGNVGCWRAPTAWRG